MNARVVEPPASRLARLLRHSKSDAPPTALLDTDHALVASVRRHLFDFEAAATELGLRPEECRLRWAELDRAACATLATRPWLQLAAPVAEAAHPLLAQSACEALFRSREDAGGTDAHTQHRNQQDQQQPMKDC